MIVTVWGTQGSGMTWTQPTLFWKDYKSIRAFSKSTASELLEVNKLGPGKLPRGRWLK